MTQTTVLLISANPWTVPMPVYPVGLARLAGAVERAGHRVVQFDVLVHPPSSLSQVITETRPDLIGISLRNIDNGSFEAPVSFVDSYRQLVQIVRNTTSVPVVLGGSGFSLYPRVLLQTLDADYGIVGQGETALCMLLDVLANGGALGNISNLIARGNNDAKIEPGTLPEFIVSQHEPAIVQHYWSAAGMVGVQTKIGCPNACSYCTYPLIDGSSVSCGEPAQVADEIERLMQNNGITHFFFADSLFNLCPDAELSLAQEIKQRALRISWSAFFSPLGITEPYMKALKESGLTHVEFGTDALSQVMLESYGKSFTVDDVNRAARICSKLDIFVAHYLAFGGPGETEQTIAETLTNARALPRCVMFPFMGIRIYPNTSLYATAVSEGMIEADDDCFETRFYLSPLLGADSDSVFDNLWTMVEKAVCDANQRWVLPAHYASLAVTVERLRKGSARKPGGLKGQLWHYLLDHWMPHARM